MLVLCVESVSDILSCPEEGEEQSQAAAFIDVGNNYNMLVSVCLKCQYRIVLFLVVPGPDTVRSLSLNPPPSHHPHSRQPHTVAM